MKKNIEDRIEQTLEFLSPLDDVLKMECLKGEFYLDGERNNWLETTADIVYFSPYLKAYKCWMGLENALKELGVHYAFLPETKDIWVRDFMPIPIGKNALMGYTYAPDYLRGMERYRSCGITVARKMKKRPVVDCGLVIDGGNVILCGSKVVMTEKVFEENLTFSRNEVRRRIEESLGAELVVIPWDRREKFGHADGVVRHLDGDIVLLNNIKQTDLDYYTKLMETLSLYFKVEELYFDRFRHAGFSSQTSHRWTWAYLNYLRVGNCIIMPQLNRPEDCQAYEQVVRLTGCRVMMVNVDTIIRRGGALNCISWTL